MRAWIPFFDKADVGDDKPLVCKVARRVNAFIMYVLLICPRNGVIHFHDRCIDDNMRALLDADRTHKACAAARRCNRCILCHAKFLRTRNSILHLDFIDFVITANKGEDKLVLICLIGDRLDRLFDGNL